MGEMTPLDAPYHNQCLTALANTNTNAKYDFYKEQAIGGIVMGDLIIYIIWERDQTDADVNSTKKRKADQNVPDLTAYKGPTTRCFLYLQKIREMLLTYQPKHT